MTKLPVDNPEKPKPIRKPREQKSDTSVDLPQLGEPDTVNHLPPGPHDSGVPASGTRPSKLDGIVLTGIIVGLFLALIPSTLLYLNIPFRYDKLLTFSGVGLILGALGSTATIKLRGLTICGTAAVVIALSQYLSPSGTRFAYGTLTGTADTQGLLAPRALVIGRQHNEDDYTFVFKEDQLSTGYVAMSIRVANGPTPTFCVATSSITRYLDGAPIDWIMDRDSGAIYDRGNKNAVVAEDKTNRYCLPTPLGAPKSHTGATGLLLLAMSAFAQTPPPLFDPAIQEQLADPDLAVSLESRRKIAINLSPDTVRREAEKIRNLIPTVGRDVAIIDGTLRAWNAALSEPRPGVNATIAVFKAAITDADLDFYAKLLGNSTPELRRSASEFISDFAVLYPEHAARVIPKLQQVALNQTGILATTNSLIILRGINCVSKSRGDAFRLSRETLNSLSQLRQSGSPSTNALLDDIQNRTVNGKDACL